MEERYLDAVLNGREHQPQRVQHYAKIRGSSVHTESREGLYCGRQSQATDVYETRLR
jgi:hypothetical protein